MSIKIKLMGTYILVAIIPLLILSYLIINLFVKNLTEDINTYSVRILDRINGNIEALIDRSDGLFLMNYKNQQLENYLLESAKTDKSRPGWDLRILQLGTAIKEELFFIPYSFPDIQGTTVVDNSGNAYHIGQNLFDYKYDFYEKDWFKKIINSGGKRVVIGNRKPDYYVNNMKNYITIGRIIKRQSDLAPVGTIFLDIEESVFENAIGSALQDKRQSIYIYDENSNIVFDHFGQANETGSIFLNQYFKNDKKTSFQIGQYQNEKYIFTLFVSEKYNWKILFLTPYSLLSEKAIGPQGVAFLLVFSAVIISVLLALFISSGISKPIVKLSQIAREIGKGNFSIKSEIKGKDEIANLSKSINLMSDEINEHIVKQNELLMKENETRLNFLSTQINPHFIYNALNGIYMSSVANNDIETSEYIANVSMLLKDVVKESHLVRVEKELKIVKTYVKVQQLRNSNKFKVRYKISKELSECLIPKMTLQPIVENSLVHGIFEGDGKGLITINGYIENDMAVIIVEDNGIGIADEEIENINNRLKEGEISKSIGLINVLERLKLHFGSLSSIVLSKPKARTGLIVTLRYEKSNVIVRD